MQLQKAITFTLTGVFVTVVALFSPGSAAQEWRTFGDEKRKTPHERTYTVEGVTVRLTSTNTGTYGEGFRNIERPCTVSFSFSEEVAGFYLKFIKVRHDEFINNFSSFPEIEPGGDLIRKGDKITVERKAADNGEGILSWKYVDEVRFELGGPPGTALAVAEFAIER